MIPKIFPRNLTARSAYRVPGNPDNTRLESGVGNCIPGLEFDHRNLDRRFFPGLVFEFTTGGAQLLAVEPNDPEIDEGVQRDLNGALGNELRGRERDWFISEIGQPGKTIAMPKPLRTDDLTLLVWRLVRCLEPGEVTIRLENRSRVTAAPVTLTGRRRTFVSPTSGEMSQAFAPGELTQSLCSPWMHDFRDCACFYWASNHPDIVLAEDPPNEPTLPDGSPDDPSLALTPIDWLRRDRASTAPAQATDDRNRPRQFDHYEINTDWQKLAVVLRGREISNLYVPEPADQANPFANPEELADKLVELAKLEHTVALQYLYARYSLKDEAEADGNLRDALTFVWHEVLVIAVSEMRHLRWVNQLLWSMSHQQLIADRGAQLGIAKEVPFPTGTRMPGGRGVVTEMRAPDLQPLSPDILNAFIAIEEPSGFLDGEYSRVLSTLRQPLYGPTLEQLAARIIADGTEHFSRFREIQLALKPFQPQQYLQPKYKRALEGKAETAIKIYWQILEELKAAYRVGDMEDALHIAHARELMFQLDTTARELAKNGFGVPFFEAPAAAPAAAKKGAGA
jgi:hypothetical protein